MANKSRMCVLGAIVLAVGALMGGSLAAQPPQPKRAAEVWIKVDELKTIFKKHFKTELDVTNYRGVSLAINRWLTANKRGDYSGFWNSEDRKDADGNVIYNVVIIKHDSGVDIKCDDLKAVFKKQFTAELDLNNFRQVSLAINRWLIANKRGEYFGLWNGEEGDDGQGKTVYGIVLIKPDAALEIKVEELKTVFSKDFNRLPDLLSRRDVSLAVNRWLMAHQRGDYTGFWNGEDRKNRDGNALYSVVLIKRDPDEPEKSPPPGIQMIPVSGADGDFETVKVDGVELRRGSKWKNGDYALYMYFRLPKKGLKSKRPVYLEVAYRDGGQGRLGLDYNAANGEDYRQAEFGYGVLQTGQNKMRTAVFQLTAPDFRHAQSLEADLRLVNPDPKAPLQVVSATLHLRPTPQFVTSHARPWLQPYKGPTLETVSAKTLAKKVLCGYQGWFRAPGDPAEVGWVHWSKEGNRLTPKTINFDLWPDLAEFTEEEKYPAPGFTYPDGKPAHLFSSAHPKTVERHFEWMAKYGIDGVLVQRFVPGPGESAEAARVLGHARAAANRTGRVFAVEYDMSGTPNDQLYSRLVNDWKWLVDEMKITADRRYLHHDGKPVLAVWGFFPDRFDAALANRIIDFFKNDPKYRVFLVGGCNWPWRSERNPDWAKVFRRFDVLSPWFGGHEHKQGDRIFATTTDWGADRDECKKAGVLYMPVIYPGFSWDNLQQKPPGSTIVPRLGGEFYWRQFVAAADLGLDMAKVAMFDEVDEGTAIFKVTNTPPTQGHFVTLENKPTDWYLRLTGEGTKLLRKERPYSKIIPIKP